MSQRRRRHTAHLHAPSKRPQQESDETAAGDVEARDRSEEEAEREIVPPPKKPQARIAPTRTKGHDFSSCF